MNVDIEYGDGHLTIDVPDGTPIIQRGQAFDEPPPHDDPVAATRHALANPRGSKRIRDLVGPSSRVVIGFPDRVKGGFHATSHRRVAIHLILEELEAAGVKDANVKLVCGIGLHRKNTYEEFAAYLGDDIVRRFAYGGLVNHDAEDPAGMVTLGDSALGDWVDFNRHAFEADLTIMLGHTMGNPYGGYSGGYKMPCTGFTGWRSIRSHHSPKTMFRDDFVPVSTKSHFRSQLHAIGTRIESEMNKPFFLVDAVLNGDSQQMHVVAGTPQEVEAATWDLASQRTDVHLAGPKANVLVVGVPRTFHYGPGMGTNPILMMQGLGSWVTRAKDVLADRFTIVAASVCDGWFNESWFPAYESIYDALQTVGSARDLVAYEESIATHPEWVYRYRHAFAYHPFHGFSMAYMGSVAVEKALEVMFVQPKVPGYARGMGARPVASFEDAVARSARLLAEEPRMIVVPALSTPAVHLRHADEPRSRT